MAGRRPEPKARLKLDLSDVPADASSADLLRAAFDHPTLLAWLNERRGRGLDCPRSVEVEVFAGRLPRLVVRAA